MKIEKINENQIRFTLEKTDLSSRNIEISELAYGTEKVRKLFKEMMDQANSEVGFDAENTPIVVEAIPVSHGGIVVIVTKVDDPDELDARFAKFTDYEEEPAAAEEPNIYTGADEILDIFKKITDGIAASEKEEGKQEVTVDITINLTKVFIFDNLNTVIKFAEAAGDGYEGDNILYKNTKDNKYHLLMEKGATTPAAFNKLCNLAGEYGHTMKCTAGTPSFLSEHFEVIIKKDALNVLKNL